jgi:hypothetical protein
MHSLAQTGIGPDRDRQEREDREDVRIVQRSPTLWVHLPESRPGKAAGPCTARSLKCQASPRSKDRGGDLAQKTGDLAHKTGELAIKTGDLADKTGDLAHKTRGRRSSGPLPRGCPPRGWFANANGPVPCVVRFKL